MASVANRIIKNTGWLYAKMAITMFISLYTTRLILGSLGASDYGIFNIVGGAISMLGFLNSTLAYATQRFMSYSEGEDIMDNKRKIFNISISLHLIIAVATVILLLCAMHPLFNGILNISPDRVFPAKIVFISFVFSTVLTIVNTPYDAVMNAHENMFYYSIVGVFESLLKLAVAFTCVYTTDDKLIVFGILMACIPLITLSIMKIYCHRKYEECELHLIRYWDLAMVKKIASFSGWNFLTAISSLFSAQGIGLVLNNFFGPQLNAAQGVANQINGQLSAFSSTMLRALNPVIVKSAGAKNIDGMNKTVIAGCKYSPIIIMFFAIPFVIEMDYILSIWLKDVPEWTSVFCQMILVQTIIIQMAGPAATAVYGQGDIKYYAIWKSVMNIAPVILVYVAFSLGGTPLWLYIPMIAVWAIGGNIVILFYAKIKCNLSLKNYVSFVIKPIAITGIVAYLIGILPSFFLDCSFVRLLCTVFLSLASTIFVFWYVGMDSTERYTVVGIVRSVKSFIGLEPSSTK